MKGGVHMDWIKIVIIVATATIAVGAELLSNDKEV